MGKAERKKVGACGGKKPKNQTIPFPMFLTPKSFTTRPRSGTVCWWGKGTLRQQTSGPHRCPGCTPSTSASESQGWGVGSAGGLEEEALPSPLIKFRLPLPLSWLRERPGDAKNDRE
jgi:hypothetical protein